MGQQATKFNHEVVIVKDFTYELTDNIRENCLFSVQYKRAGRFDIVDAPFPLGNLQFRDTHLGSLDGFTFDEKKILELINALQLNRDGAPKFVSLMIKLFPNTLCCIVSINKNIIERLKSAFPNAYFQLNGCVKLKENIDGQWVPWGSRRDIHFTSSKNIEMDSEASVDGMESYTIYSSTSTDFEATRLAFRKERRLRISFNLEISFHWESEEPPLSPMQLDVPTIMEQTAGQDDPKDLITITVNGKIVGTCHKAMLSAFAKYFGKMMKLDFRVDESDPPKLSIDGISEEVVKLLIKYLKGEKILLSEMGCKEVSELLEIAYKNEIPDLESYCVSYLLSNNEEWYTVNLILKIYVFLNSSNKFLSLKTHLLRLMRRMNLNQLRSCVTFQGLDFDTRIDLLSKLDNNQL